MGIMERQYFLAELLTNDELRLRFNKSKSNEFKILDEDYDLLKGLDKAGIERKANLLKSKSGKPSRKASEGA